MKSRHLLIVLIFTCITLPLNAVASSVRIEQLWWGFVPIGGTLDPSVTVNTVGVFDDTGLTGLGDEVVALHYFGMSVFKNGIGQNFNIAVFPTPPSTTEEGNIAASFHNGTFTGLNGVNLGGSARIAIIDGNSGNNAGGINIAGNELIWSFPVSGTAEYRLQSTELVYPTIVPLPATAWLFLSGLPLLLAVSRRRTSAPG